MKFRKWIKITLVLVYLVILAGALVRMTGSGMGCPDWPKCFGHWVPPIQEEQLKWHPDTQYKKGQVIINNQALYVAQSDFTSGENYSPKNWKAYTKHDYATFNPAHTWIEYMNRLLGALAGLASFILAVLSVKKWRSDKRLTVLAWVLFFAMGLQGWLGATVVYSKLAPFKITIHMLMALVIVALLLWLFYLSQKKTKASALPFDSKLYAIAICCLALTLIQTIAGTQVRQLVDTNVSLYGYDQPDLWLQNPSVVFYVHRSFSILLLLANVLLYRRNRILNGAYKLVPYDFMMLVLIVVTGIAMVHFNFPFLSQPLHLVLATLMFGLQFYLVLQSGGASRENSS